MKTSCISHPPKTPLVIIREEYLAICDGDHCEASILNQFEYWTNIKLGYQEQAETESKIAHAGGIEIPPSDLWIYKSQTELHEEIMGLFGIRAIGTALQSLVDRGFLERRNNPKYAWDRTYQYRLQTTKVQDAILQKCKFEQSKAQPQKQQERDIEPDQNETALPETTTEITSKETAEKETVAFPEKPKEETDDEKPKAGDSHGRDSRSDDLGDGVVQPAVPGSIADALPDGRGDDAGTGMADPVVEAIIEQPEDESLDAGTDLYWQHCREAKANQDAGRNYAAPPTAGGDDGVAYAGLVALHEAKGGSPPRVGTGTYVKELEAISQALRDRAETAPEVAVLAAQMFVEEKSKLACPHYKSFVGDYGEYLGRARGQLSAVPDRHARYDTPNVQASQAAWEERMAARPPPAEDDKVGQAVKGELQLQMTRATFDTWVKGAGMACDDGVFVVTVSNALTRAWLENRLATTIKRTAVGVVGPVEVRFEVTGGLPVEPLPVAPKEVGE